MNGTWVRKTLLIFTIFLGLTSPHLLGNDDQESQPTVSQRTTPNRRSQANQTTTPVFNQIELNSEGVNAIDTSGNVWIYDFDKQEFLAEDESQKRNQRADERLNNDNTIDPVEIRCVQEKSVKPLSKNVLVGYDEYVDGDVVVIGRITVKGWVRGDVHSLKGRVLVTESGQIDGDIKAPEIVINEGGVVLGKQTISGPLDFTGDVLSKPFQSDGIIIVIGFFIFFLVATFLIISLFPRQQGRIEQCMFNNKIKTMLIGFTLILMIWLPIIVLAITIVGVIALPFVPLAYIAAVTFGCVSLSHRLGNTLVSRFFKREIGKMSGSILGLSVLMTFWILTAVFFGPSANGISVSPFAVIFLIVSILVSTFPVLSGLGATFLTRFGFRDYQTPKYTKRGQSAGAPSPAPPPIPQMPGMVVPPPITPISPMSDTSRSGRTGTLEQPTEDPDIKPPLPSGGE